MSKSRKFDNQAKRNISKMQDVKHTRTDWISKFFTGYRLGVFYTTRPLYARLMNNMICSSLFA